MIGEESMSTREEIRDLWARLIIAFARDQEPDAIDTWEDDGGRVVEDPPVVPFCSFDSTPQLTIGRWARRDVTAKVTGNRLTITRR